jgi:iron complex outermembrane receptor protein
MIIRDFKKGSELMIGRASIRYCACLGALAFLATGARAADPTASESLTEIVVTAEKRSESIQDVPVSITVLNNEILRRQGVTTITDLSRMSASLEFTAPGAAPGGGAFIRGIGTETVGGATATGSVSVVLDGVVLGNTNITDIFDVARVEVLKGPQGTLFGSSVSAGVINITTNAPDPSQMSSSVSAEYGSGDLGSEFRRTSIHATTNLPLNGNSALRLSVHSDQNDGVFLNPYLASESTDQSVGARARYLVHINDDVTLNLIGDYNRQYQGGVPTLTVRETPTAPPYSALATALAQCGVTASDDNRSFCTQNQTFFEYLNRGAAAQVDWNFGSVALTSISSYRLGGASNRSDIEGLPLANAEANLAFGTQCQFFNCVPIYAILPGGNNSQQSQDRTQISEELRLASVHNEKFEWVAGIYYQHYKLVDLEPGLLTANFGGGTFTEDTTFNNHVHTQDYAVFGNVVYHINDQIQVFGGARWTHSDVSQDKYDPPDTGTQDTYSLSVSASKPSWRIGIQDRFSAQTMAYATISTGYKAPEISDLLTNGGHLYEVAPELPTSYEIGVKQSMLDNHLAVNADVFYTQVKNYQGQSCSPNNQGTVSCAPSNVPVVNTKGLELDVFGTPWTGMSLNLSGIVNPATYPAGYKGSDGSDLGGQQLNYASKYKATFSAEQLLPISATYGVVLGADAAYRSEQSQYVSALPQFIVPGGTIFNARVGIRSTNNWAVYLFGRNIGEKAFPRQLFPIPFQTNGYWQIFDQNSLRVVGFQAEARF